MKLWSRGCPDVDVLATYLDGNLDPEAKNKTELHLANCAACCSLVADVVAMWRSQPTPLPLGLEQRAIAITSPQRNAGRRLLIPVTAALVIALSLGAILLRTSKEEISAVPTSNVSPVVAKSEPPPSLSAPATSDTVRQSAPSDPVPGLIFPRENAVIKAGELFMKWKAVPRASYYEVHLVDADGEPLWLGESQITGTRVPDTVALKDGAYFVWIAAHTEDGRVQKSSPVWFVVNSSR
jgi:hypothetical protein